MGNNTTVVHLRIPILAESARVVVNDTFVTRVLVVLATIIPTANFERIRLALFIILRTGFRIKFQVIALGVVMFELFWILSFCDLVVSSQPWENGVIVIARLWI